MDRPSRAFAGVLAVAALLISLAALATGAPWLAFAAAAAACVSALALIAERGGRAPRRARDSESAAPSTAEPRIASTEKAPEPARVQPAEVARPASSEPTPTAPPVEAAAAAAPAPAMPHPAPAPASVSEQPAPRPRVAAATKAVPAASVRPPAVKVPVTSEPEDVLEALLESSNRAGRAVSASLWLEDPATATVRRIAAVGTLPPAEDFERLEATLLGESVTSGAARFGALSRVRSAGAETLVWRFTVPVSAGDVRGAVAVDMAGSQPDRSILAATVAALRAALSGALALHVARVEAETARTLTEAAHDLARLLDPDDVVSATLERAMRLSSAQTGSVMLVGEDGRLSIAAARGLPDVVVETASAAEGEGIAGWVLASKQPVVVEDLEERGPQSRRHGIRSAISVPIADKDGMLGVLNVGSRKMQARFSRSHVEALETLGRCAALALRNARATTSSADLYFDSLKALALAMETKDPYARGATERVVEVAELLGRAIGLDHDELRALTIAGLLHDIGMDAAGEGVATQRRTLSTVEWGMVKLHPSIAKDLLEQAPALKEVVPIVYHHHEHYDGTGYTAGVAGERIPLGARILSIADAWVAMTSERPYRRALNSEQAIAELEDKAGSQFDPLVVETFVGLVRDGAVPTPAPGEFGC
ncbi:MAG: GAF domain-containing protein [Coriobacteriales bacterium]|nr:GAF domain-containing protein [Coriobacteriales bacterium]